MLQFIIPVLVDKIFDQLVKNPINPVERQDAPVTKPEIRDVIERELEPVLQHQTNNEPWYQSRVTIGSITAIVGGIAGLLGYTLDEETTGLAVTVAMSIVGGALAWYGRWKARKPLKISK